MSPQSRPRLSKWPLSFSQDLGVLSEGPHHGLFLIIVLAPDSSAYSEPSPHLRGSDGRDKLSLCVNSFFINYALLPRGCCPVLRTPPGHLPPTFGFPPLSMMPLRSTACAESPLPLFRPLTKNFYNPAELVVASVISRHFLP